MMEQKERALLVGVNLKNQDDLNFEYSMEELKELAIACEMEVVGMVSQKLNRVNTSHYIGKGKIEEVVQFIEHQDANVVVFDDELSPSQIKNLESDLDCKVIDRTMLILDIFAERAKTKEAKLQVEVAQLEYMLPRLIGLRESLGRQGGGSGLKNRGAGETKLELDRRKIEERITSLNKELEVLVSQREMQRKQRRKNEIPVVSLVGYTNAGKSTIMNAMVDRFNKSTNKQVFEKDMLFATLDTSVRSIKLPDNKSFLLTDTVGFVAKLPHHLVKAFRSTLEEVAEADLLIHVVDYSNPHYQKMIDTTLETLKKLGIHDIPMIYAFNKADLVQLEIPKVTDRNVYLSAKQKIGIDQMIDLIKQEVFKDYILCEMLIPYEKGEIISYLNERANVLETSYEPEGTKLKLDCKKIDHEKYQQYVVTEERANV
ncbi:GTPase HflX [Rossellomorea sp. BNER]|uniref:GTPase HflX n=1 Tax=Rossellomorea sp. BNER TaxID=2962031 RepID=UPI003AF2602B|nr:GTPase HflX [Rossellomorea sp. BNER]